MTDRCSPEKQTENQAAPSSSPKFGFFDAKNQIFYALDEKMFNNLDSVTGNSNSIMALLEYFQSSASPKH